MSEWRFGYLFLVAMLVMAASHGAQAGVIQLKNGDRITGKITKIWDRNVTIEPEYSDELEVEFAHIVSMQSDTVFEVELADGTRGDFQIEVASDPGLVRLVSSEQTIEVELGKLKKSDELKPFDWGSRMDLNSNFSRGNTDSQLTNFQADLNIKKDDHRYVADFSTNREKQDGDTVRHKDKLFLAYNYLYANNWFFALNSTVERDPIALLDHRVSLNPSIGYDFWDDANRTLSFQLGVGYATEKTDGEDENSSLIDWRLRFAYDLRGGDLELFHDHHIYKNLDGRENSVVNSSTGVRYDITDDIYLNVQLDYDYDTEPAEGTEPEDVTFVVGAGLEF
jgi:putative salt-induced outer membrane protein YdiY